MAGSDRIESAKSAIQTILPHELNLWLVRFNFANNSARITSRGLARPGQREALSVKFSRTTVIQSVHEYSVSIALSVPSSTVPDVSRDRSSTREILKEDPRERSTLELGGGDKKAEHQLAEQGN